jgi:hypothetical protein
MFHVKRGRQSLGASYHGRPPPAPERAPPEEPENSLLPPGGAPWKGQALVVARGPSRATRRSGRRLAPSSRACDLDLLLASTKKVGPEPPRPARRQKLEAADARRSGRKPDQPGVADRPATPLLQSADRRRRATAQELAHQSALGAGGAISPEGPATACCRDRSWEGRALGRGQLSGWQWLTRWLSAASSETAGGPRWPSSSAGAP